MAEGKVEPNKCGCDRNTCTKSGNEPCYDYKCTQCRACCDAYCPGCKEKCNDVTQPLKCKCRIPFCGCKTDCYKNGENDECSGVNNNCERCRKKCTKGKPCICYQCSCGERCNGVICSCCSWCDSTNCSGGPCNGYVIGRCKDKGKAKCDGHVMYHYGKPVYNRENLKSDCQQSHGGDSDNCNKWAITERDENDNCVIKCTYCGKLCSQDICRIWLGVIVILSLILASVFVMRAMFPEKFHAMMSIIRAAVPISSRRPVRSFTNLVGDKIPEEMNTDHYPAFRPRTYAGLA